MCGHPTTDAETATKRSPFLFYGIAITRSLAGCMGPACGYPIKSRA